MTRLYETNVNSKVSAMATAADARRAQSGGAIASYVEGLRKDIGNLEDAINRLTDKLGPSLAPVLTSDRPFSNEDPPKPACSDLASELLALSAAISNQAERVNSLNVRCEL